MSLVEGRYVRSLEQQSLKEKSIGFQEVYKTLQQQTLIPTELLNWTRQLYIEGIKADMFEFEILPLLRTKAIDLGYSNYQIQQTLERVRIEMQSNPRKIAAKYERMSKN